MRILRISAEQRTYPRYVAEHREGRFKGGPYPHGVEHVPPMKRKWDRGGFGTGTRLTEVEADSIHKLLEELRMHRIDPRHDDVEIFEIRSMGSPRVRVPTHRLYDVLRTPAVTDEASPE